jgi:DNA-directed RNA polymerase specialized sigma24 family protein
MPAGGQARARVPRAPCAMCSCSQDADIVRAAERPDLLRVLDAYARSLERIAAAYARSEADRDDLLQDFAVAIW